ncbi:hypothetical protein BDQ12DRAFT_759106 [Crucibulum laeve]|uniref:Uncharacterized protein n=1 Tax=Crucibulum laeve TaxID=68775 RepID=A0A5C3LRP2_9AGAR|nr:hypothetical protein BDQ12DRAFT_759106 [Crucibulum laeve]
MAADHLPTTISGIYLAGSLLSLFGSGFILLCYLILPMKHHFRHVLILNLATADFLNALDISASGFWIVVWKSYALGTDCAILAITLVTVYTITRNNMMRPLNSIWNWSMIFRITFAIWFLPIITSSVALGMNWCWVVDNPRYARYLLTHGWRFLFITIEIGSYTYLYIFLRKHHRTLSKLLSTRLSHNLVELTQKEGQITPDILDTKDSPVSAIESPYTQQSKMNFTPSPQEAPTRINTTWKNMISHRHCSSHATTNNSSIYTTRHRSIQRILLLNAYPLAYIVLLVPGLVNRLIEASGKTSRVMQVLQASTQFVGLANALTYGWNEKIAQQLKRWYRS